MPMSDFARLSTLYKQLRALAANDILPARTLSLVARILNADLDVRPTLSPDERAELKQLSCTLPPPVERGSDAVLAAFEALLSRCVHIGVLSPAQHLAFLALRDEAARMAEDDDASASVDESDSWSLVSDASSWAGAGDAEVASATDEARAFAAVLEARLEPLRAELGNTTIRDLLAEVAARGRGDGVSCQLPLLDADASMQYTVLLKVQRAADADGAVDACPAAPPAGCADETLADAHPVLSVLVSAPAFGTRRDELVLSEAGTCVGTALPFAAALKIVVRMITAHQEAVKLASVRAALPRPTYALKLRLFASDCL